jgi:hypothetical protein
MKGDRWLLPVGVVAVVVCGLTVALAAVQGEVGSLQSRVAALEHRTPAVASVSVARVISGHRRADVVRAALARRTGVVSGPLVYVCGAWPCHFDQVFATYDQAGNPLLDISPYGDIGSDGLAYSVFPLGNVFDARTTLGWTDPVTYASDLGMQPGCVAPRWYLGPSSSGRSFRLWRCVSGRWVVAATWR